MNYEINEIIALLDESNQIKFREIFLDLHAYDQAQIYLTLERNYRIKIFQYLNAEELSDLFEYFEEHEYLEVMGSVNHERMSKILEEMDPDDAVDFLQVLSEDMANQYLDKMNDEASNELLELMHYDEDSAGSIMTSDYIQINEHDTVKKAMKKLIDNAGNVDSISYLYALNDEEQLMGVISLKNLIIARGHEIIEDIMTDNVMSVLFDTDQEEVAKIMTDYDFLALPVVDDENHMLGMITIDDIVDVINEEVEEDYAKLAGLTDVAPDLDNETVLKSVQKRLPWLIILTLIGMVTSALMANFEEILEQVTILAFFLSLILAMSGNTGTQALAVTIRGITDDELDQRSKIITHLLRELTTGMINGVVIGILVTVLITLLYGEMYIGMVVGISIIISLTLSTLMGALVPLFMNAINVDPAIASGPLITTFNDLLGLTVYLSLATYLITNFLT